MRTSDDRFDGLPDWPYEPRYVTISDDLRVHYVAEGPEDGPTVLLTHGEPTWGYLYRKMIPGLVDAGCRVVAPDLVGFGRSDKPTLRDDYTYGRHLRWLTETIEAIGLDDIILFCQDWGGLLGLIEVARHPERYRAVVASNTGVPPGIDLPMPEDAPFIQWRQLSQDMDPFSAADSVAGPDSTLNATGLVLSDEERRAYDAPFPDESHCAGARQFPLLVPLNAHHPGAPLCREAWPLLSRLQVPLLTAFGEEDHVTGPMQGLLQTIPGAEGLDHRTYPDTGHFLQEIVPDECVAAILEMVERTA